MTRAGTAPERARHADGELPVRGPAVGELGLPLPRDGEPAGGRGATRMSMVRGGRPLKRWRYIGAFGPEVMLCAGDARIGPLRQRWWAVAEPSGAIVGRTSALGSAGVELAPGPKGALAAVRIEDRWAKVDLLVDAGAAPEAIEVVSPSGPGGWIWTRKRAGALAGGVIELGGRSREVELETVLDDSAGYHERHTAWHWSAGVGVGERGERVGWNLVDGLHDSPGASERTVWVDGEAREVDAVSFAPDLSGLQSPDGGDLAFEPWAERAHRSNLLLVSSDYRQPFGVFSGWLPGGVTLAAGYGVMETHEARW